MTWLALSNKSAARGEPMNRTGRELRLKLFAAALCAAAGSILFALIGPARAIHGSPLETPEASPQAKYSTFSHDVSAHKMDCSKCHNFPSKNWKAVRPADSA
ncbi:MAG TPA: hypothetical protein DEP46_04810, partial [Blastocatellia bacterium]|nr:hypothetical protein [Blastocatellia bacterium]